MQVRDYEFHMNICFNKRNNLLDVLLWLFTVEGVVVVVSVEED